MITIVAVGYCPRQPELRVLSESAVKCEFEVLTKRNSREGGAWVTVIESATFVAWNDQARTLAEHLTAGREITAMGRQETQRWTDGAGVNKKRIVHKLTDFEFAGPKAERRGEQQPSGKPGASEYQAQPTRERSPQPPTQPSAPVRYARQSGSPPAGAEPPPESMPSQFDDRIVY